MVTLFYMAKISVEDDKTPMKHKLDGQKLWHKSLIDHGLIDWELRVQSKSSKFIHWGKMRAPD